MSAGLDDDRTSRRRAVSLLAAGGWLATFIYAAQSILLVPMYLDYLGSRLYGFWLASGGVIVWLAMVDFGVAPLTTQRCGSAYGQGDLKAVADYCSHGALITFGLVVVVLLAGFVLGSAIPGIVRADAAFHEPLRNAFWLATGTAAAAIVLDFVRGFASALQRVGPLVAAGLAGDLLAIVTTVAALWAGWGVMALALGGFTRFFVPLLVGVPHAVRLWLAANQPLAWSANVFRDYLQTAPVLLAARTSGQFVMGLPAVLIGRTLGPEATVIYSVSIRAVQVAEQFFSQALLASGGALSHLRGQASGGAFLQALRRWTQVLAALGVFCLAMVIAANSGFVRLWVGSAQYAGQAFTIAAVVATGLSMLLRALQHVSFSMGATTRSSILGTVENVARGVLLVLLVPAVGIIGVPVSIALAALLVAPAVVRLARRRLGELPASPGMVRRALGFVVLLAASAALSALLVRDGWWAWLAASSVVALILAATLVLMLPEVKSEIVARRRRNAWR